MDALLGYRHTPSVLIRPLNLLIASRARVHARQDGVHANVHASAVDEGTTAGSLRVLWVLRRFNLIGTVRAHGSVVLIFFSVSCAVVNCVRLFDTWRV